MIDIECLPQFAPLINKKKRIKILVGGRSSTKSTFAADYVATQVSMGQLWCCAREFQNSIDESVHRMLCDEIERLGLQGFTILANEIHHVSGGRCFYKGLARNITSLKSTLSGIDGLWIEEAESLSDKTLRVLTPSVRASALDYKNAKDDGAEIKVPEIWLTMNRGSKKDPVAQKWLARAEQSLKTKNYYEDDAVIVVQANYTDIPKKWFEASGLEQERLDDLANMNKAQYEHTWHGQYLETVDNAIIMQEWFEACVDAHKKLGFDPEGIEVVSHDPSDTGPDPKGLCYRHGVVIKDVQIMEDGDVNEGCDWALDYCISVNADGFIWDADGMGAALKKQIKDKLSGKSITPASFSGASMVDNPDEPYSPIDGEFYGAKIKTNRETFLNRRAQAYWELRDRVYATFIAVTKKKYTNPADLISFDSDMECLDLLRSELCRIPRKDNGMGKIQILNKVEMKKLEIDSPNAADAVMMSFSLKSVYNFNRKKRKRQPVIPVA